MTGTIIKKITTTAIVAMLPAWAMAAPMHVVCTTFPIYQITRNVAQGADNVKVELLLPASLGCPHHYSLKPQDMQKLAQADVLVVNGLGMEEFLGAPVKKANPHLHVIDSARGVQDLLHYDAHGHDHHAHDEHAHGHHHTDAPYEWAGAFTLQPGMYTWTFAKREGHYADPAMKMLIRKVSHNAAEAIDHASKSATRQMEREGVSVHNGGELSPAKRPFVLTFDQDLAMTTYRVNIDQPGTYVFFTEHMPTEFEDAEHFFKDENGLDVEPMAQAPELDNEHAHHDHAHQHEEHDHGHTGDGHAGHDCAHHDHGGVNPHLFVSPRQRGQLALNIAAGLSEHDTAQAGAFFKNASDYTARMNALADEMATHVAALNNNRIVQPHGIFDYLAKDLGLEIVAVTQPHGQEPSAAEMLDLVNTIREKQAGAVFTEPQYSPKVGQTLARETGIPTAVLDPVASGPANAPLDYYESIMRKNMETLRATLGIKE